MSAPPKNVRPGEIAELAIRRVARAKSTSEAVVYGLTAIAFAALEESLRRQEASPAAPRDGGKLERITPMGKGVVRDAE